MIKYAAMPVLAFLAACSAQGGHREAAEANGIESLSVNNLVITDANTVSANSEAETQVHPTAQPAQTAAPLAETSAASTRQVETKQQAARKASSEAATKQPPKSKAAPAAESKEEPEAPADTCTPEHRAMGHC